MVDSSADDMLRSGYNRWLRLEEDKAAVADDLRELFAELKANGFDSKALRLSFRRVRDRDDAAVAEQEALVDLYVASLTRDARDAREEVDPLTGEILDTESQPVASPALSEAGEPSEDKARQQSEPLPPDPAAQGAGDHLFAVGRSSGRTEPSADGQTIHPGSHVAADHGDEGPDAADDSGSEPGSVASASGDNSAAKASRFVDDKPLRPYCLHPGPFCGGYGRNHCGACQRAASNATVPA